MTKRQIDQFYFGNDVHFWTGIVEDRNDPLQVGRLRVRIAGHHTDDTTLIPTAGLPWAAPLMPMTAGGGVSGVGQSVNVMNGALILGFWGDYPDCQIPIMMGFINQIEQGQANSAVSSSVSSPSSPTTNTATPNADQGGGTTPLNVPGNKINDTSGGLPGTTTSTPGSGGTPAWMNIAFQELAKSKTWTASLHHTEILKYLADCGLAGTGEHPWCAAFVKWCLDQAGQNTTGLTAAAVSPVTASCVTRISTPQYGCLVVINWSGNPHLGHVGFWLKRQGGSDVVLSGNTSHTIGTCTCKPNEVVGYFMPSGAGGH